uniref:Uncharacterized protein n=1 Tax=Anguilla anguilla TaxID=7936 RepID=A0A0E9U2K2_ANGAN
MLLELRENTLIASVFNVPNVIEILYVCTFSCVCYRHCRFCYLCFGRQRPCQK